VAPVQAHALRPMMIDDGRRACIIVYRLDKIVTTMEREWFF
jgi:hypothetical protein